MCRLLDSERIQSTATALRGRVSERYPGSGLLRVTDELLAVAGESAALLHCLSQPIWTIRILVAITGLLMVGIGISTFLSLGKSLDLSTSVALLQGVDARARLAARLEVKLHSPKELEPT